MLPEHKFLKLQDFDLSYYEWGDPDASPILFVHATGMNARVWDETIKRLPDTYRILAIDLRGHGGSRWKDYVNDWSMLGNDVIDFIETLELKNILGVGHSMGGHCMLQAAMKRPELFERLVLVDPVIFDQHFYDTGGRHEFPSPTEHPIARRRNHFRDWEEMFTVFSQREPYSLWNEDVLENYCRYGLIDNEEGSKSLACWPETEASIYMSHRSVNPLDQLIHVEVPTKILRARFEAVRDPKKIDFSLSPTWPELASAFPDGVAKDVYLPHLTHFIPMQDPDLMAKEILEA
ncbi:alpha/beta fold hydrolase [Sneathiella sp. P13V-1]|uniref:alpha/beta fold hydrolase n=1 Tax=Sneathiella sp. P13V-1 TaxID=2697366 RepID=UPI00187B8735|nr:alpha/beta hydrolase [Sneathiella sp. P13V-1]MBE7637337.1 alpha/beta fold hydrolase [Sneathiella sp. P13V-1]